MRGCKGQKRAKADRDSCDGGHLGWHRMPSSSDLCWYTRLGITDDTSVCGVIWDLTDWVFALQRFGSMHFRNQHMYGSAIWMGLHLSCCLRQTSQIADHLITEAYTHKDHVGKNESV
jgi:hypothetical protein